MSNVPNYDEYLKMVIDILREHKDVMTPSQIASKHRSVGFIPSCPRNFVNRLYEVMLRSFRRHDGIFFLSLKGKKRFGLIEWLEPLPYLDCVIDELIKRGKQVYQRKEINEAIWDAAGRVETTRYVQRLQEEGKLERVGRGLYKVIEPLSNGL